jgi:mannose-1-phosphate guanylyltransferase
MASNHIHTAVGSSKILPVILCGGAGTRLWPMSRQNFPKPFMKVGSESLIAQTVRRAKAVGGEQMLLVSNAAYQFLLQDECLPVLQADSHVKQFHQLLEPVGRNTAPAIALAALWAQENAPDAVLLVLPADHLITPQSVFLDVVNTAVTTAKTGRLVCFGIQPTAPETGFGYIQVGSDLSVQGLEDGAAKSVRRFIEKPDAATALQYLTSGEYLWNGGMFAFTVDTFLAALTECAPDVLTAAHAVWAQAKHSAASHPQVTVANASAPAHASVSNTSFTKESFLTLPDISIDYAVMEKSSNVAAVPAAFAWSDIGSWSALAEQQTKDEVGNSEHVEGLGEVIQIASRNTHVATGNRTVATLGVDDLLIIDTADALLVAHKDKHQDVKKVVAHLKAKGSVLTEFHPTVHRPWGTYTVLEDASGYKIKRIEVKPGAALSLQMHHHRSEHWIVVSGTAKVTNGDNVFLVRKNESTYIPAGNKHRLENPGRVNLVMIEVQSGDYLEEDDIVRFEDTYGRA